MTKAHAGASCMGTFAERLAACCRIAARTCLSGTHRAGVHLKHSGDTCSLLSVTRDSNI